VVARVVRDKHRRFAAHPTREFVPILVEDAALDTLRVMPTVTTDSGDKPPTTGVPDAAAGSGRCGPNLMGAHSRRT
jgi:hypothetical protein